MNEKCWYFAMHGDPAVLAFKGYRNVDQLSFQEAIKFMESAKLREAITSSSEYVNPVIGWCGEITFRKEKNLKDRLYIPLLAKEDVILQAGKNWSNVIEKNGWDLETTTFSNSVEELNNYLNCVKSEENIFEMMMHKLVNRDR